jgi:hypothetical protein
VLPVGYYRCEQSLRFDFTLAHRHRLSIHTHDTYCTMATIKALLTGAGLGVGVLSLGAADASLIAGGDGETVYDAANDA